MTRPIIEYPYSLLPEQYILGSFEMDPLGFMPKWMAEIAKAESEEFKRPVPMVTYKRVDYGPWIGGYSNIRDRMEGVVIVYGRPPKGSRWRGSENEKQSFIHELSHWLIGPMDASIPDWHNRDFYEVMFELSLKYTLDIGFMMEMEYNYQQDRVLEGIEKYHYAHNV